MIIKLNKFNIILVNVFVKAMAQTDPQCVCMWLSTGVSSTSSSVVVAPRSSSFNSTSDSPLMPCTHETPWQHPCSLVWCSVEPSLALPLAGPCCSCVSRPEGEPSAPLSASPKTWNSSDKTELSTFQTVDYHMHMVNM